MNPADHIEFLEGQIEELEAIAAAAIDGEDANHSAAVKAREQVVKLTAVLSWARKYARPVEPPLKRRPARAEQRKIAVRLVASGWLSREVAAHVGADVSTINRWRQDPEFAEELRDLQQQAHAAVHDLMVARSADVANALVDLAVGGGTQDMARVHACRVFFELLGRHKGAPVAPAESQGEPETEAELLELLRGVPPSLLEEALKTKSKRRKAAERDL